MLTATLCVICGIIGWMIGYGISNITLSYMDRLYMSALSLWLYNIKNALIGATVSIGIILFVLMYYRPEQTKEDVNIGIAIFCSVTQKLLN